jgi:hypothetical protein
MNAVILRGVCISLCFLSYNSIFSQPTPAYNIEVSASRYQDEEKQSTNCIKTFPYYEELENSSHYFTLNKHPFSTVQIYTVQNNTINRGLLFKGSNQTEKWTEAEEASPSGQLWDDNMDNIASMHINVDAALVSRLFLRFDIKQTYKTRPQDSYFRVLVNGEQIKNIKGLEYLNPATKSDRFKRESFDLSSFTGDKMRITLQSLCRSAEDCAFIEYITFDNAGNADNMSVNYIDY